MRCRVAFLVGGVVVALAACSDNSSTAVAPTEFSMRATSVTSQPAAAPPPCPAMAKYGRQAAYAPAGSLVCKYYDRIFHPAKDLPPIKNTRPNENLVRTAPQHLPPRPAVSQRFRPADALSQSLPQPGNGDEGWLVNYQSTQWGPGAMEIAQPTLNIPSSIANLAPADTGVVIFAPTNKPQGSCLEMTPIYQRLPGSSATSHSFGWYNWCGFPPQWTLIESWEQDPFWLSDYTITAYWPPEGQNVAEIYWEIHQVGSDCWEGLLFNFAAGNYEQKAQACGTPGNSQGWSMWESYYLSTHLTSPTQCPTLPHVDAYIPVGPGPTWLDQVPRSPIGPFGICWDSGKYWSDFYIDPNGGAHTWRAHTP